MSHNARVRRALTRLAQPGALLAVGGGFRERVFGVFADGDRRQRPLARLEMQEVRGLERDGVLRRDGDRGGFVLTEAGLARVRRREMAAGEDAFQAQHRVHGRKAVPDDAGGVQAVTVNRAESPLMWLKRRGSDGQAFVSEREFCAGERLRRDHALSVRPARVTMDWSGAPAVGGRRAPGASPLAAGETAAAARQRVEAALAALGPGLDHVVRAVCCDERGLDAVERAMSWPRRSAKLALKLGLARLADHYRLAPDRNAGARTP